jgi:hypothetical protein
VFTCPSHVLLGPRDVKDVSLYVDRRSIMAQLEHRRNVAPRPPIVTLLLTAYHHPCTR